MDFATNFKRICTEKGTNPTAVCKELGVSTSKVNLWNNGSLPKQEMLVKLARHLGCSVMDFFADEEDIANAVKPENDDESDILRVFRMLDRRTKHEFMSMVYEYENRAALQGDKGETGSAVG